VEPYVTPDRFRTMGFGIDLDGIDEVELRSILGRSSDRVNQIASAPGLPQPHDFRGGAITDESHIWRMGDGISVPMQRSIFLWHTPIVSVQSLRIRLTNTQGITFSASELMVFPDSVEIVSLAMTSVGMFGAYIVPEVGLDKPRVVASYTYGQLTPIVKQRLEPTDGRTFRAQDQWWDRSSPVVVYDAADAEVSSSDYTIDYDEGCIVFDDNQAADARYSASFVSKLPAGIATATGTLAAEKLGDREMRQRGMTGLRAIRVGEIALEKDAQMRGQATLVTPAEAQAEALLAPYKFLWAGA
jgi:hypothetical protein